ncbi:MAG: DUF6482 family protein [Pseudomonadales bacterium]
MKLEAFKELAAQPGAVVEVLAIDPIIYLIRCTTPDRSVLLSKGRDKNWSLKSLAACQRLLQSAGLFEAVLVQESAYSEMVGSDAEAAQSQMRMPLTIPRDPD